jgi:hypothetical protein
LRALAREQPHLKVVAYTMGELVVVKTHWLTGATRGTELAPSHYVYSTLVHELVHVAQSRAVGEPIHQWCSGTGVTRLRHMAWKGTDDDLRRFLCLYVEAAGYLAERQLGAAPPLPESERALAVMMDVVSEIGIERSVRALEPGREDSLDLLLVEFINRF